MSRTAARTKARRTRRATVVGLIVVTAAIIGTLVYQSASSSAQSQRGAPGGDLHGATVEADGAVTMDDGAMPDGATVFADQYPGIANLDPALLQALRAAATDAAADGIEFSVSSGWRSPEYQNQLLREAISTYGSEAEAARWVASADASAHVSGDAVDIGPFDATVWLSEHGVHYGLCQIYGNEPWHFELSPEAIDRGCAPVYPDPTYDPRMQQ